jgi:hypothetical protein
MRLPPTHPVLQLVFFCYADDLTYTDMSFSVTERMESQLTELKPK